MHGLLPATAMECKWTAWALLEERPCPVQRAMMAIRSPVTMRGLHNALAWDSRSIALERRVEPLCRARLATMAILALATISGTAIAAALVN